MKNETFEEALANIATRMSVPPLELLLEVLSLDGHVEQTTTQVVPSDEEIALLCKRDAATEEKFLKEIERLGF